ncbi:hypothetical protein DFH06DRAFT_1121784 [Mycena polygramma]|nr:hypothetical protein DFH06DRAFT_1121784 [Mycena polygramma]
MALGQDPRDNAIDPWAVHYVFAPRLFTHVEHTKQQILGDNWTLRDNFVGGAFHASEFFLGADESAPRLDDLDMLWSWRAVTALGRYQARWGGELILWEEKKVIKFPVGATILFPAAFTQYSFTQVCAGEAQYAFSQYCGAGPFRYVENGYRCEANFDSQAWRATRKAREAMKDRRMETALGMYNFLDKLDHLDEQAVEE